MNGLWFTSLFLSLTTALVVVLVKQWLHHYVALPSGTPRDRSFTRQFRYAGFQKWHVQVIIGLLPVLMHLALAIFLVGLVIFLQPLRQALSWIICAGTGLVYTAYAVVTILPILFPQCPYRTPLCDIVYIPFCRIVPQVIWSRKKSFFSACRQGNFSTLLHCLPGVQARNPQSVTMIESKFVQQMSTNLAAEALDWLFSVSSNPSVQSIVIQSIGGLPMTSEEKFLARRGNNDAIDVLRDSLLIHCLQTKGFNHVPVLGMELKLGRLLRFYPRFYPRYAWGRYSFIDTPDIDSFELTVAILSNGHYLYNRQGLQSVRSMTFIRDITRSSKLPPRCWYHLMMSRNMKDVLHPLDPDNDDHANTFPLRLCSAILYSLDALKEGLTQDFNSPLVLDFEDALPYFLDKIYDLVLPMFSKFVKDSSLNDPSLSQSLRVFVVAIEFMLHRLSLPRPDPDMSLPDSDISLPDSVHPHSDMFRPNICQLLTAAIGWIHGQTFSSQEATAVMTALEDIIALCVVPPLNIESDWSTLCKEAILAYRSLTTVAPSACSLRGLRPIVDFMTSHWDYTQENYYYYSSTACTALTSLLAKRIPVAFTAFLENQCLQFLGNNTFREESVPMVSAYVAGIFTMQHRLDGAVDAETHIDYLYNPHNLLTACSILATHGIGSMDRTAVYRDITTLVQLRPRDAAWDDCRRKLRDLVQGDGGDFFSEQRIWPGPGQDYRSLQPDEVQVKKDNIRYAIHVLDDFFDRGVRTTMVSFPQTIFAFH